MSTWYACLARDRRPTMFLFFGVYHASASPRPNLKIIELHSGWAGGTGTAQSTNTAHATPRYFHARLCAVMRLGTARWLVLVTARSAPWGKGATPPCPTPMLTPVIPHRIPTAPAHCLPHSCVLNVKRRPVRRRNRRRHGHGASHGNCTQGGT